MTRLVLPAIAAVLLVTACGESTPPPEATTLIPSTTSVNLDALGATQTVTISIKDQNGQPMVSPTATWTANAAAFTATGTGTSGTITAVANGSGTVTVASGKTSQTILVNVAQRVAQVTKVSGDFQTAAAGQAVSVRPAVVVQDSRQNPIPGVTVTFMVVTGGGAVVGATAVSDASGVATVGAWQLGSNAIIHTLSAAVLGLEPVVFSATATGVTGMQVSAASAASQTIMAGTTVPAPPGVLVRDLGGAPVPGITVNFAVTDGAGTITGATAVTDATGVATLGSWRIGTIAGPNTVSATVTGAGVTGSPVNFTAIGCQGGGGTGFAITLCFSSSMTPSQRFSFEAAAARWAAVIAGDLPDVTANSSVISCVGSTRLTMNLDDVVIFASVVPIDGPGGVLASAGPCLIRTTGSLPTVGTMRFDAADVANDEQSGRLGSVIQHEMGHVLGIGTLWNTFTLLQNPSSSGTVLDTHYSGANGVAGFDAIGGLTYTGGFKVPVENTGGPGTINGHWREAVMRNELMTGFINAGANPLSLLTVRSLEDMGYVVNAAAADDFFLSLSARAPGSHEPPGIRLVGDVLDIPLGRMDRNGRIGMLR